MKKLFSLLVVFAALSFVACKSEKKSDKTDAKSDEKMESSTKPGDGMTTAAFVTKAHVCTAACKDGNHVYAHGDVGHTCTEACGMAAHSCTEKCKDGNHFYAHGETGHTCTEECMKM
jgi:hypothetical protein